MLDTLRKSAQGWVAKVLIGLLAVSFAVWGIADVFRGFDAGFLARVGKVEITSQEYTQAFNQYLQNVSRQTGQALSPAEARQMGIDRAILDNLIRSAALDHEAAEMKLSVPDSAIAAEAAATPAFQNSAQQFDPAIFRRVLANNGMTEEMYLVAAKRDRLRQAVVGTVEGSLDAPQPLVEAVFRHRNEQRDARYFAVTTPESEIPALTDDEIRKEFDANPAAYTAPEYRTIALLKAEAADVAARVQLSEADVAAAYEKLKGDYFTPEKRSFLQLSFPDLEAADAAKSKLAAGTDFLALAKELGFKDADVTFADKAKGDLLDSAIADAVFSTAQGEVSEPVKGALATVLVKVTQVTPEKQASLDEVRGALTDRLKLERAADEVRAVYDAVEDGSAGGAKLDEIAKTVGLPLVVTAKVDASGLGTDGKPVDIQHKDDVLKAAFASDVGLENAPLTLDNGYVWYDVKEVVPSSVRPFDSVKDQARASVLARKMSEASLDKAKKLVERAKTGTTLDALAQEIKAEVKAVQGLKRGEGRPDFPVSAITAVYAVPENSYTLAAAPDGSSAWVIQSQSVMLPPFDPASAEAKAIATELTRTVSEDLLGSFMLAVQKDVGTSINEALWQQVSGLQTQ